MTDQILSKKIMEMIETGRVAVDYLVSTKTISNCITLRVAADLLESLYEIQRVYVGFGKSPKKVVQVLQAVIAPFDNLSNAYKNGNQALIYKSVNEIEEQYEILYNLFFNPDVYIH